MVNEQKGMKVKENSSKLSLGKKSKSSTSSAKLTSEGASVCPSVTDFNETSDFADSKSFPKCRSRQRNKIEVINILDEENTNDQIQGTGEMVSCQVCSKNITHMNSKCRQQHVNRCIDKQETEEREAREMKQQLEAARTVVLDCPMCGKVCKTQQSRTAHLKKCRSSLGVSTDKLLLLIKQQEIERASALEAGLVPQHIRAKLPKSGASKKSKAKEPKSQFEEDVQVAMAISSSLLGDAGGDIGPKKGRRKHKVPASETVCMLTTLTDDDRRKQMQQKISEILSQQAVNGDLPALPVPESSLRREHEATSLWERCNHLSEGGREQLFYVGTIMPPVAVSQTDIARKLRSLSDIPGREKSFIKPPSCEEKSQENSVVENDDVITVSTQVVAVLADLAGNQTQTPPLVSDTAIVPDQKISSQKSDKHHNSSVCVNVGNQSQNQAKHTTSHQHSQEKNFPSAESRTHVPSCDDDIGEDDSPELLQASGFCVENMLLPERDQQCLQQTLLQDFHRLLNNKQFSDVSLKSKDGKTFHAHKIVLWARCPGILKMEVNSCIPLDVTSATVKALLLYLYTGELSVPACVHAEFTTLATALELPTLVVSCEKLRLKSELTSECENEYTADNGDEQQGDLSELRESQIDLKAIWGESDSDTDDGGTEEDNVFADSEEKGTSKDSSDVSETYGDNNQETSTTDVSKDHDSMTEIDAAESPMEHTRLDDSPLKSEYRNTESTDMKNGTISSNVEVESEQIMNQSQSQCVKAKNIQLEMSQMDSKMVSVNENGFHSRNEVSTEFQSDSGREMTSCKREHVSTNETPCAKRQKVFSCTGSPLRFQASVDRTHPATTLSDHAQSKVSASKGEMAKSLPSAHNDTCTSQYPMEGSTYDESGVDLFGSPSPVKPSNIRNTGSEAMEISFEASSLVNRSPDIENKCISRAKHIHSSTPAESYTKNAQQFDSRISNIHPLTNINDDNKMDLNTTVDEFNIYSNIENPNKEVNLNTSNSKSAKSESRSNVNKMCVSPKIAENNVIDDDLIILDDNMEEVHQSQTSRSRRAGEGKRRSSLSEGDKTDVAGEEEIVSIVIDHQDESSLDSLPSIGAGQASQNAENNSGNTDNNDDGILCLNNINDDVSCADIIEDDIFCTDSNESNVLKTSNNEYDALCLDNNEDDVLCTDNNDNGVFHSVNKEDGVLCTDKNEDDVLCTDNNEDGVLCTDKNEDGVLCIDNNGDDVLCMDNNDDGVLCMDNNGDDVLCTDKNEDGVLCMSYNDDSVVCEGKDNTSTVEMDQSLPQHQPGVWDDFEECGVEFEPPTSSPLCEPLTQSIYKSPPSEDGGESFGTADVDDAGTGDVLDSSLLQDGDDSFVFKVDDEIKEPAMESKTDAQVVSCYKTPKARQGPVGRGRQKRWVAPSPFTPMPAYQSMATPNLKNEVKKYGVKPVGKKRMVKLLEDIYKQTHQYETDSDCEEFPNDKKQPEATLKSNKQTTSQQPAVVPCKKALVSKSEPKCKESAGKHLNKGSSSCPENTAIDAVSVVRQSKKGSNSGPDNTVMDLVSVVRQSKKGSNSNPENTVMDAVSVVRKSKKGSSSGPGNRVVDAVSAVKQLKEGSSSGSHNRIRKEVCLSGETSLAARIGFKTLMRANEERGSDKGSASLGSDDSAGESDESDVAEESFVHVGDSDSDAISPHSSPQKTGELSEKLMKLLSSEQELHVRILMYEPLELDVLKKTVKEAGIKCSMNKLMDFLDERCIAFTSKNTRKQPAGRSRGRKPAKSQTK